MCHRWCYGQVILQKWHILAGWVLTALLCACFAGVWITIGSPKAEDTAGLLATGVVVTGLAVLFGLGSCMAGICAPSKSKLQYFVVASDQPAHVVVDPLDDLEAEVNKHIGPPFPEMMPNGNRNGKVVRFAPGSRARVAKSIGNGKLPKRQNEQKRVEQKAIADIAAVAAAAGIPLPEPAPAAAADEEEQKIEPPVG